MSDVVPLLLAITTLADSLMQMVQRYEKGEMTDEELAAEWAEVVSRTERAEAIMLQARKIRASRDDA